ncbi:hypothetical protein ACIRL0_35395 [Streptomyces sp. NPDC102365]|uniref:hypothetical protein n=1 Tax=Streptomyces sp. NPDC102365 TaxID=3366162 RepID=UPI00381A735F
MTQNQAWRDRHGTAAGASPEHRNQLLRQAVAADGSAHGADHGLCRIHRNESWHFEPRPEAVGHRCPDMYADPTEDLRTRQ